VLASAQVAWMEDVDEGKQDSIYSVVDQPREGREANRIENDGKITSCGLRTGDSEVGVCISYGL
jgi:hypothetical protein